MHLSLEASLKENQVTVILGEFFAAFAVLFCFSFFTLNESFSAKIKFRPGHLDYELVR